jgi:hypothetical protein
MAENSAIPTQRHTPRNITEVPLKTVVRHFERANQGRIKRHLWESPMFHFLPSWQDFRRNQIDFAAKDLDRQIAVGNDSFIRWQALQQAKYVWYCGGGSTQLERCVAGEGTDTTNPKDAAWFQAAAAKVGSAEAGFLSFIEIQAAASALQHQVGAPAWEGMLSGTPKDNEVSKGKYILTGDGLVYDALPYDSFVLATKKDGTDYLNSSFRGPVGDSINFLQEHFPLRYLSSATTLDTQFVAPEIEEVDPTNSSRYEKVPNPPYAGTAAPNTNCDIGIAFVEGYMPFEVFDVGPPPKEFASGSMSMKKYSSLRWNGKFG